MTIGIEKRNQVYSYLETHPGATQIQLRKAFPKMHTSDISHLVAEFCREGLAVTDGRTPRRYWAVSLIAEEYE